MYGGGVLDLSQNLIKLILKYEVATNLGLGLGFIPFWNQKPGAL